MNLVAALFASRDPLPFREIAGRVVGYDDAAADEALEKRFDRDKTELRRLGIPIRYCPGDEESPSGYVIPEDEVFQQRVSFTPQEAMLLSIAGRVGAAATGGGPLEEALKSALRKLAVDIEAMDPLEGVADVTVLRSRSGDPRALANISLLGQAVTESRAVQLTYSSMASDERVEREVEPYGLGLLRGAWYLVGYCRLRVALRVFKVARIVGHVTLLGAEDRPDTFSVPTDFRLEKHLEGDAWELGEKKPITVTLHARTGVPIEATLPSARTVGEDAHGVRLELEVRRPQAFIGWILAQAGRVVVLKPSLLRQEIAAAARRLQETYQAGGGRLVGAQHVAEGMVPLDGDRELSIGFQDGA